MEGDSRPSDVVKTFHTTVIVANTTYDFVLVTMRRSFLLVINNIDSDPDLPEWTRRLSQQDETTMSRNQLIQSFMNEKTLLSGLSLSIGGHSTCLIASENSVASQTLAARLSKAVNQGGPVYVVNNINLMEDTASLYDKVFRFVRQNYTCPQTMPE